MRALTSMIGANDAAGSTKWSPIGNEVEASRRDFAITLDHWRSLHEYYYSRLTEILRFIIPAGESVLVVGCEDGAVLSALDPARGVGVDCGRDMIRLARRRHPEHTYRHFPYDRIELDEQFEYIVLFDMTGEVADLQSFLDRLAPLSRPTTRVIVVQHNYLWRPIFTWAASWGLKRPEPPQNWLSIGDTRLFLYAAGFETVSISRHLFCPIRACGIGPVINAILGWVPGASLLATTEILVARPMVAREHAAPQSCSIVLTVRDECPNVEPMVMSLPQICERTEIIFVEGHSVDGTRQEVERVARAYPEKNIRLLVQPGTGQGDAIRHGFDLAEGEIILLLEADQTSPPEDILKVWQVLATGRAEFVNGTRAVYPRLEGAMPIVKRLGNLVFAVLFTWFLGQRTTDVLCGLKGIVASQYRKLRKGWGFTGRPDPFGDFELLFGAARLGLKTCEVPIRYAPREHGRSKSQTLRHGWMLARMALAAMRMFRCN